MSESDAVASPDVDADGDSDTRGVADTTGVEETVVVPWSERVANSESAADGEAQGETEPVLDVDTEGVTDSELEGSGESDGVARPVVDADVESDTRGVSECPRDRETTAVAEGLSEMLTEVVIDEETDGETVSDDLRDADASTVSEFTSERRADCVLDGESDCEAGADNVSQCVLLADWVIEKDARAELESAEPFADSDIVDETLADLEGAGEQVLSGKDSPEIGQDDTQSQGVGRPVPATQKFPIGHSSQVALETAPGAKLKDPEGHFVALMEASGQNEPGGHRSGTSVPDVGQNRPGGQGEQAFDPALERVPAGQAIGFKELKGQYDPPGHACGAPPAQ